MSMYIDILDTALRQRSRRVDVPTVAEAMAELLECRNRLGSMTTSGRGEDWTADALADQVAFDVALIELARSAGIECDPAAFEQPDRSRTELIRTLMARGLRLDESVETTSEQ
jgi:hypothetical protein